MTTMDILPNRGSANTVEHWDGGTMPTARDTLGNVVPLGYAPQALGYDGSGNLTTITVTYGGNTWIQTLTYTGTRLTNVSAWVKQ